MPDSPFDRPRVALNRIYTRQGDAGETRLAGGQTVPKDSPRIDCYGIVDELNSIAGIARVTLEESPNRSPDLDRLAAILLRVQHELFNLGSILATLPQDVHPRQARVTQAEIDQLEAEMDSMNAELAPLRSFVLPGGCRANAELHLGRTVCRRAERVATALARIEPVPPEVIAYLNRLSDAFFVWSRWVSHKMAAAETLWEPNKTASGNK
ncbi:MAG: cob(I)yrinic acid a,c-diamide adenosyltransferase [Candidatus Solibacter usitatus]|nr:cob(I)yrinic acid a,c-diamide adenosyltransferase [Candidatus Solibacter usitatus]